MPAGHVVVDERLVPLGAVLDGISSFRYWYDFGDDWWHRITVEERLPLDDDSPGYGYIEAGEDFDPARFDRHAANAALVRMAWNRWE